VSYEAGSDEVDANGREFERQIFRNGRHRRRESRDECEALSRVAATRDAVSSKESLHKPQIHSQLE